MLQEPLPGDRRVRQELTAEKQILEHLAAGEPLERVLEALCRGLERTCAPAIASVLLLDDDGLHLRHGAAPSLPPDYWQTLDGLRVGGASGSCGVAAHLKTRVIASDISTDVRWRERRKIALDHDLSASWSTPVTAPDGALLGTLALYFHDRRSPTDDELAVVDRAIDIAALAIQRSRSETDRESERQVAQLALESMGEAIVTTDHDGAITYLNPMAERLTGFARAEAIGRPLFQVLCAVSDDGRELPVVPPIAEIEGELAPLPIACSVVSLARAGTTTKIAGTVAALRDRGGAAFGSVLAVHAADGPTHDAVPQAAQPRIASLPSHEVLLDRLGLAMGLAKRHGKRVALLFLGIEEVRAAATLRDGPLWPGLLDMIAERLTACIRSTDTVGTQGRGRFIILLAEVAERENAVEVARKILGALAEPFTIDDLEIRIGPSIGVSVYPDDGDDIEIMSRHADAVTAHGSIERADDGGDNGGGSDDRS